MTFYLVRATYLRFKSSVSVRHLLIVLFFSLLGQPATSACGYYVLGEQYRIALLNPYLIGEDYPSFFYSSERLNHLQNAGRGQDRQRNVAAWASELGAKVGPNDVMALLYDSGLADWVDPQSGKRYADNPAWQAIHARPDLLAYVRYIKGYESKAVVYSYWDKPEPETDKPALAPYRTDYQQRALTAYQAAAKHSFLKERYAYQLLLLAYYDDDEATMAGYFNRHFKNQTGALADWARFHVAGTDLGSGSYTLDMANAFRNTPEKAIAAYDRTENVIDPTEYLTSARDQQQRSNLYALAAVKQKGSALEYIKEAYRLDPTNPILDLLLVREFNKVEDWLLSHRLTGMGPALPSTDWPEWSEDYAAQKAELRKANYPKDRAYLKELRAFIDAFQAAGTRAEFATILRAQAALLDEDYQQALTHLAPLSEGKTAAGRQVRVIRYLALLQGSDLKDASVREALAEQLLALEMTLEDDNAPQFTGAEEAAKTKAVLSRIAAQQFSATGDTATAYFLHNRSLQLVNGDTYCSDYYGMIDFLDRPLGSGVTDEILARIDGNDRRTAFNRLLLSSELPPVEAILDIAGTVALRRNDLPTALAYFQRVPRSWYDAQPYFKDGFNGYWQAVTDENSHLAVSPFMDILGGSRQEIKPLASKAELVRRLIELEKACSKGEEDGAKACLALGQAWFNLSAFGPAWMLLTYGKSADFPSGPVAWPNGDQHAAVPTTPHDFQLIYRAERAKHYLDCAAAATNDRELAAALDLSQRTLAYRVAEMEAIKNAYGYLNKEERTDLQQTYLRLLSPFAKEYANTEYFRKVIVQCSLMAEL
jgi:hypothetical protein